MKINHFSWDTDYRFIGDKYDEDKPLFLGHNLSFFWVQRRKLFFLGTPSIYKERKLNKKKKKKNSVQLANTCDKNY